jgi:hypothetical protein
MSGRGYPIFVTRMTLTEKIKIKAEEQEWPRII